jgi:hypothetical protein
MAKINYKLITKIEISILLIISVISISNFLHRPEIQHAIAMATTVMPETFTELYFENHTTLPQKITRWQTHNFTFTTHNLEYKDASYPYEVYVERGSEKILIERGTFTLPHDAYKSITIPFGPLKLSRSKIVINLIDKNQQIAFWMEP